MNGAIHIEVKEEEPKEESLYDFVVLVDGEGEWHLAPF